MFRLCNTCKRNLPLEEYLPSKGYECNECVRREQLRREAIGEIAQARTLMTELMGVAEADKVSTAPKLDEICGGIVDKFGGPQAFVAKWYEQFTVALNTSPGSTRNLQHFIGIFRLISEANKHKREDDVSRMTSEQIQNEQKRLLLETLLEAASDDKRKEVASRLFAELGLSNAELTEHKIIEAVDP
jgi:hypothetical protein